MIETQFLPLAIRAGLSAHAVLDGAAIRRLVDHAVVEDEGIDFKQAIPQDLDKAKKEMAKTSPRSPMHRAA